MFISWFRLVDERYVILVASGASHSSEAAKNAKLLREFQLIPKLLLTLRDQTLSQPTVAAISNVLSLLLQGFPNSYDLLRYTIKHASSLAVHKCHFELLIRSFFC